MLSCFAILSPLMAGNGWRAFSGSTNRVLPLSVSHALMVNSMPLLMPQLTMILNHLFTACAKSYTEAEIIPVGDSSLLVDKW